MVNILIPVKGYVHLYRSLLRFYDMPENEIKEMLYLLNTANVDCYGCYHLDRDLIITSQREALQTLRCIISNIEYRFYKAYSMEIEDKRTVYDACAYHLIPKEDEPSVCIMHDWIYLPSA